MALNKTLKTPDLFFEKLGYTAADSLYQYMRKSADYYYIGFLTQVGVDAPTNKILYTDFLPENGITFTYEGTGKYRMYCNLFKPGYVEVEVNEGQNNSPASSVVLATVYDGYVEFTALDGGTPMDDVFYETPVKVKVWTNAAVSISTPAPPVPGIFITSFTIDSSTNFFNNSMGGFSAYQTGSPGYYASAGSPYDTGLAMRTAITDTSINTGAAIEIYGPDCTPGTTGWFWITDYSPTFPSPTWEVTDNATFTGVPASFYFAGTDLSTANYEAVYTYLPGSTISDVQIYNPGSGGPSCGPGIVMGGYGLGLVGLFIQDAYVDQMISGFGGRACTFQLVDNGTTLTIKVNNCLKTFAPSTIYLNDTTGPSNFASVNFVEL
jgi:hypothetical protein